MRPPLLEVVVMAVALGVALATGAMVLGRHNQTPPAVMHCICPEPAR